MLPNQMMQLKILTEFRKLKREKPNALDLGIDYINYVLKSSKEVAPQLRITHRMVAQLGIPNRMLYRKGTNDMDNFEFQIIHGHPERREDQQLQEFQGYVDVTIILIALQIHIGNRMALYGRNNQDDKNLSQQVRQIPQVRSLPKSSQEIALKFIGRYFDEILEEFEGSSVDSEMEVLLNKTVAKAKNNARLTPHDNPLAIKQGLPIGYGASIGSFYYRGALTAQDTYLLYYELIRSFYSVTN